MQMEVFRDPSDAIRWLEIAERLSSE